MMKYQHLQVKATIAAVVCVSLLVFPYRVGTSMVGTPVTLKSESQFRTEASLYDGAIRAISGILTMKLETQDDLKAALGIVERQRPNLKLFRSKLVVIAFSNSTFSAAAKRKMPTKEAAITLLTSLNDRTKVTTIAGFDEVKNQMKTRAETDAAVLRRASDRLKTAGERLKSAEHHSRGAFFPTRASFSGSHESNLNPAAAQDPLTFILFLAVVSVAVIAVVAFGSGVANSVTDEGRDAVADCQDRADQNYSQCVASSIPFTGRIACAAILLAEQALCLVAPDQVR